MHYSLFAPVGKSRIPRLVKGSCAVITNCDSTPRLIGLHTERETAAALATAEYGVSVSLTAADKQRSKVLYLS
jgi:hypothetical protein